MLANYFKATKWRASTSPSRATGVAQDRTMKPGTNSPKHSTDVAPDHDMDSTAENELIVTPALDVHKDEEGMNGQLATTMLRTANEPFSGVESDEGTVHQQSSISEPAAANEAMPGVKDVAFNQNVDFDFQGLPSTNPDDLDIEMNRSEQQTIPELPSLRDSGSNNVLISPAAMSSEVHIDARIPSIDESGPGAGQQMPMPELVQRDNFTPPEVLTGIVSHDDMALSTVQNLPDDIMTDIDPYGSAMQSDHSYRLQSTSNKFLRRRRAASVPPVCGNHYTFVANWPPPHPPRCDLASQTDIFPPKDAPLHVWVQAYALRWGVWAAEIKDDALREQVLSNVFEKMKLAWETAITEGYYIRPTDTVIDTSQVRNDSDGQGGQEGHNKRGRKRAQSPSRVAAGFACEGKDPLAITNGELAQHGLTMEIVERRKCARDFDAAQLLLDNVLASLPDNRERLIIRDWSATHGGSARGRNLLMYCFFVVQDARDQIKKLNSLMSHFTRELQKKNTLSRIEMYQEREAQHLALATELHLRQQEEESNGDLEGADAANPTDLTSETSSDEATSSDSSIPARGTILELAQDVLSATSDSDVLNAFSMKGFAPQVFNAEGGLRVGSSHKYKAVKLTLGNIFQQINLRANLKISMQGKEPAERIKIGYDAQIPKEKIAKLQKQLRELLKDDLHIAATNSRTFDKTSGGSEDDEGPQEIAEIYQGAQKISTDKLQPQPQSQPKQNVSPYQSLHPQPVPPLIATRDNNTEVQHVDQMSSFLQTPWSTLQTVQGTPTGMTQPHPQQMVLPHGIASIANSQSNIGSNHQNTDTQDKIKQEYIDQHWIPLLNAALLKHGKPQLEEVVSQWPHIKNILTELGFSAEERNQQLRSFKAGFEGFLQKKGVSHVNRIPTQSPTMTARTSSPAPSYASVQRPVPSSWPTDFEILAAIQPQGVHIGYLMQLFGQRIGQNQQNFLQTIARLANLDMRTHMVYQKQQTSSISRQYDTMPPQVKSNNIPATSISTAPPTTLPTQERPGIVKLKFPTSHLPVPSPLQAQDESQMAEEFKSTSIDGSRGFSFRHLPHATLEQRQRMDEEVGEYIQKSIRTRKTKRFGHYVTFVDPRNPSGPVIMHGFWENKDKTKPQGSQWFFNGEDMPADWDVRSGEVANANDDTHTLQQGIQPAQSMSQPVQPSIKLRFGPPATSHDQPEARRNAQAEPNFNPWTAHNMNPASHMHNANNMHTPGHYNASYGGGSIDPRQLSLTQPGSSYHSGGNTAGGQERGQIQAQDIAAGAQRGTKRAGSGNRGNRRKKRRQNVVADDEDDDDYDPSQDH